MKTTILTVATLFTLAFGISQSTYAATIKEEATILNDVSQINKIEIHGNVELYVSDGTADQVKVYNNYYAENALVQNQNGVLRISSYQSKKLVVWVTVSDLRDLSVYDNAEVRSFGKLSAINLDVKLYNSASAQLDLDAYQAAITLSDNAIAELSGDVSEGELNYGRFSSVNITNLATAHITKTKLNTACNNYKTALASL